jgi:hypothetical protein
VLFVIIQVHLASWVYLLLIVLVPIQRLYYVPVAVLVPKKQRVDVYAASNSILPIVIQSTSTYDSDNELGRMIYMSSQAAKHSRAVKV